MTDRRIGPGVLVGPYRIESLVGQGGMGQVFRAHDTKLNRPVAIKVLSGQIADRAARHRFQREAQTASSLNHPHILTVHDAREIDGQDYLITEFVDGGTLSDWSKAERRSWRQVVQLMIGVADGLATAHGAGILHRDVKPGNILVARNGYAKLADFGLARPLAPQSSSVTKTDATAQIVPATVEGLIVGTVAYMSPEQAMGHALDQRSDIFSFGVVLYELLAGERPFSARSDVELLSAIIRDTPKPLPAEIPFALRLAVEKALEKDPADRYQSLGEMVVDLRRLARLSPADAITPAAQTPPRSSLPRWIAGAAVVVSAVLGTSWLLRTTPADANPLANATFTRLTDFEGTESDAAISRDGKFVALRSDRDGPVDTWVSQIGSGRFLNLTHGTQGSVLIRNTGFTPDGSEVWLSALIGGARLRLVPLTGGTPRAFLTEHAINLSWSPDGSAIAFHTYDTGDPLFVSDAAGSNARQIYALGPGGHLHFPTWSTDGKWIYFVAGIWDARQMDVWRIRPSGGTPERLTTHNADVRFLAPLDARTVLYVAPDQNGAGPWLWSVDAERKVSRRVSSGIERYSSVDSSADGRRIVATISNPTANLWTLPLLSDRLTDERDVQPFKVPNVRAFAPRYGGNAIFYLSSRGGGDGLWRYADGQSTEVWRGADGALLEPGAISLDGQHAAVILRKDGKRTLYVLSADGGDLRPLAPDIDVSSAASWSPDGGWIVAGGIDSRGPGLFKIPARGGNAVRLAQGLASNPVWSPDGSVIAYTGPVVGITGPLLLVHPDGTPGEPTPIQVRVNGERYRFIPGQQKIVYIPGSQVRPEQFWLFDLATKKARQLSNVVMTSTRTFDVTADGKHIVFDRQRENSDIVLIERPE